jgi:hypothetical protein
LCKEIYKCEPDDPRIEKMDPFKKLWMFENWVADQVDQAELAKNHAYLLGSFWNPEAVKKLMGDGENVHVSSDEELEKSMEMVRSGISNDKPATKVKKRKRKKIRT